MTVQTFNGAKLRVDIHYTQKVKNIKYPYFFVQFIYAMRARIAYINYTKSLGYLISLTIFV